MHPSKTVLRRMRDEGGTRYLGAYVDEKGDLIIEGQDLGPAVERILGVREYEWVWTVKRDQLPLLARELGGVSDLLKALEQRFSGDAAAGLHDFLREKKIPFDFWSRRGD